MIIGIIVIMGTFNKDGSFGKKHPELASNWDYDENKRLHELDSTHPLTPFDVAYSSHRKVAMKCNKHGTYMQAPSHIVYMHTGCPKCAQLKNGSFGDNQPDKAQDWDYDENGKAHSMNNKHPLTPFDVSEHSACIVFMKCHKCGTPYSGRVGHITEGTCRCKQCYPIKRKKHTNGRNKLIPYVNDSCTTDRRIIKYWDYRKNLDKHLHDKRYPIDPFHASIHSSFKENFICFDCNYEWESTINNFMQYLLNDRNPCHQCRQVKESKYGSVADYSESIDWDYDTNASMHAMNRNHPAKPEYAPAFTSRKYAWKCHKCGNSWFATGRNRCKSHQSCPKCASMRNGSLGEHNPELICEWDVDENHHRHVNNPDYPDSPFDIAYSASSVKTAWICSQCGHHWNATPNTRTNNQRHRGCPRCAIRRNANGTSAFEDEIYAFICEHYHLTDATIIRNDRTVLNGKELDILIPSKHIAIEINGDYYHSDEFIMNARGISAYDYHKNKYDECMKQGIALAFLWQNDWYCHETEMIHELDALFTTGILHSMLHHYETMRSSDDDRHYSSSFHEIG